MKRSNFPLAPGFIGTKFSSLTSVEINDPEKKKYSNTE
jgi:hypothetical protein